MSESKERRVEKLTRQEALILEVTEALCEVMAESDTPRATLAKRIGRSKAFVSQILGGERNLTLRTIADVGDACGYFFRLVPVKISQASR